MSETDWADKPLAEAENPEDTGTDTAPAGETLAGDNAPEDTVTPTSGEETAPAEESENEARVGFAAYNVPKAEAPPEPEIAVRPPEEAAPSGEPEAEAEVLAAAPVEEAPSEEEPEAEAEVLEAAPVEEAPSEEEAEAEVLAAAPVEEAPSEEEPEEEAEVPEAAPVEAEPAVESAPEPVAAQTEEAVATGTDGEAEDGAPPPPPDNPNHKWYILQTYSGFELRVERTINEKLKIEKLEELVGEIFVPGEDVERVKNGKKRKTHVIYYPGYVLIKMELTDELWHLLMDIPRVSGFVGGNNREPRALEENELGAIRSQMNQGMQEAVLKDEFEVGQHVIVIDGPFANFSGNIDEVNTEKSKLRVLISILGRSTPVELDFDKVKEHPDAV